MKFWQIIGQWVLPILSIISAIVCVCVLCKVAPRQLGFDYMGVIVAVLGAIITFLVGWQIYNVINWKNEIQDTTTKLRYTTQAQMLIVKSFIHTSGVKTGEIIDVNFQALELATKGIDEEVITEIVDNIILAITEDHGYTNSQIHINREKKKEYLSLAKKVPISKRSGLKNAIESIKPCETEERD